MQIFTHLLPVVSEEYKALCDVFERESKSCRMFGGDSSVFDTMIQTLNEALGNASGQFNTVISLISLLNTCANQFEKLSSEEVEARYWLGYALSCRVASEKLGTIVLHATRFPIPVFESSLAELRLSCAYIAKSIGDEELAHFYASGVFRLAASEHAINMTKHIMSYKESKQ